jgi:hypothetical protein
MFITLTKQGQYIEINTDYVVWFREHKEDKTKTFICMSYGIPDIIIDEEYEEVRLRVHHHPG